MPTDTRKDPELVAQLEGIQALLIHLKEDALWRSHRSVLISFEQMLTYTAKISKSGMSAEVKRLLEVYQEMAEKFYTQCEFTLLDRISGQLTSKQNADRVLGLLSKVRNLPELRDSREQDVIESFNIAESVLTKSVDDTDSEYVKLKQDFPHLLQEALDKLKEEWQRLSTIAMSSRNIARDEKLIQTLNAVVEAARFSVGIDVKRIAVIPGDTFALQFYSYLKDLAILTVPIYSVQAPWEWSIFWHELAGEKVRRLENNTAFEIDLTLENLKIFHQRYQDADEEKRKKVLRLVARNEFLDEEAADVPETLQKNFIEDYLEEVFSDKKKLLMTDLGGFERQFERMLENLPRKDRFINYEQLKAAGWCVDWLKELFEDAWSVLAIGQPFLHFFHDILNRHVAKDTRHPPTSIRLDVANEILRLIKPGAKEFSKSQPIEQWAAQNAAQQILRFVSLLKAASMTWVFKISTNPEDESFWQALQPRLSKMVGREIGFYIGQWSEGLNTNITADEAADYADEFIVKLTAGELSRLVRALTDPDEDDLQRLTPSYSSLLQNTVGKPKSYEELLELSFYDVDFFVGDNPTFLFQFVNDINMYKITAQNLKNALAPENGLLKLPSQGGGGDTISINNASYLLTRPNLTTLLSKGWVTT